MFASLEWLGVYLQDGRRLVQVMGVEPKFLRCEDAQTEGTVRVAFRDLAKGADDPGWRRVARGGGAE